MVRYLPWRASGTESLSVSRGASEVLLVPIPGGGAEAKRRGDGRSQQVVGLPTSSSSSLAAVPSSARND